MLAGHALNPHSISKFALWALPPKMEQVSGHLGGPPDVSSHHDPNLQNSVPQTSNGEALHFVGYRSTPMNYRTTSSTGQFGGLASHDVSAESSAMAAARAAASVGADELESPPPISPSTKHHGKKRDASYIPRAPNAFILFRSSFIRNQAVPDRVEGNHSTLSKIIGAVWRNLPSSEREKWEAKAKVAQEEHRKKYPDWRFKPGIEQLGGKQKGKAPRDDDGDIGGEGSGPAAFTDAVESPSAEAQLSSSIDVSPSMAAPLQFSFFTPEATPSRSSSVRVKGKSRAKSPTSGRGRGRGRRATISSSSPTTLVEPTPTSIAPVPKPEVQVLSSPVAVHIPPASPPPKLSKTSSTRSRKASSTTADGKPSPEDARIEQIALLLGQGIRGQSLEVAIADWERHHFPGRHSLRRSGTRDASTAPSRGRPLTRARLGSRSPTRRPLPALQTRPMSYPIGTYEKDEDMIVSDEDDLGSPTSPLSSDSPPAQHTLRRVHHRKLSLANQASDVPPNSDMDETAAVPLTSMFRRSTSAPANESRSSPSPNRSVGKETFWPSFGETMDSELEESRSRPVSYTSTADSSSPVRTDAFGGAVSGGMPISQSPPRDFPLSGSPSMRHSPRLVKIPEHVGPVHHSDHGSPSSSFSGSPVMHDHNLERRFSGSSFSRLSPLTSPEHLATSSFGHRASTFPQPGSPPEYAIPVRSSTWQEPSLSTWAEEEAQRRYDTLNEVQWWQAPDLDRTSPRPQDDHNVSSGSKDSRALHEDGSYASPPSQLTMEGMGYEGASAWNTSMYATTGLNDDSQYINWHSNPDHEGLIANVNDPYMPPGGYQEGLFGPPIPSEDSSNLRGPSYPTPINDPIPPLFSDPTAYPSAPNWSQQHRSTSTFSPFASSSTSVQPQYRRSNYSSLAGWAGESSSQVTSGTNSNSAAAKQSAWDHYPGWDNRIQSSGFGGISDEMEIDADHTIPH